MKREAFDKRAAGSLPVEGGQQTVSASVAVRCAWADSRPAPTLRS